LEEIVFHGVCINDYVVVNKKKTIWMVASYKKSQK
jgi:hypothetical protein